MKKHLQDLTNKISQNGLQHNELWTLLLATIIHRSHITYAGVIKAGHNVHKFNISIAKLDYLVNSDSIFMLLRVSISSVFVAHFLFNVFTANDYKMMYPASLCLSSTFYCGKISLWLNLFNNSCLTTANTHGNTCNIPQTWVQKNWTFLYNICARH